MDATNQKIANFLGFLEERTLHPIDTNVKINESCTATLLLIFVVIDSLSKITCTNTEYIQFKEGRGNKVRFMNFLKNVMGHSCALFKDLLYGLRNDIVHTAINVKVVLSKDKDAPHLKEVNGSLWINTSQFLNDLKETVKEIHLDIADQGTYFQNAANRLQELNFIDVNEDPMPSRAPNDVPFR